MNERIRELADQADGVVINKMMTGAKQYTFLEQDLEKFAELIVRECARVIDRGDGEMSSQAETIWCNVCRDVILKHFGVE